jgi:hypothetical protein
MQPSGNQLQRLQTAMLNAFGYSDLRRLLRLRLEAELEQIVPIVDRNLTQIVYSLIRLYAAQPGGLLRLTEAAQAERPARPDLAALAAEFATANLALLPLPEQPPDATIHTGGGLGALGNVAAGRDVVGRDQYNYQTTIIQGASQAPFLYVGVPPMSQHFVGRETLLI